MHKLHFLLSCFSSAFPCYHPCHWYLWDQVPRFWPLLPIGPDPSCILQLHTTPGEWLPFHLPAISFKSPLPAIPSPPTSTRLSILSASLSRTWLTASGDKSQIFISSTNPSSEHSSCMQPLLDISSVPPGPLLAQLRIPSARTELLMASRPPQQSLLLIHSVPSQKMAPSSPHPSAPCINLGFDPIFSQPTTPILQSAWSLDP